MRYSIHNDLRDLKKYKLIYLASPYSKYPYGIDEADHDVKLVAGRLLQQGINVFSPIAHTHGISRVCNIDPYDYEIWQPADDAIMDNCDAMLVLEMTGYKESNGVNYEINRFAKLGLSEHIHYLDIGVYR